MTRVAVPSFAVIPGTVVRKVLAGRAREVVDLVETAYRLHGAGDTVNPPSYFIRFPDRPNARIIALPASIGGQRRATGLKWIASFPDNVDAGLARASAVLVLNDVETGYPYACLESSVISASRTAASAAAAAVRLSAGRERTQRVGFVGAGLISRYVHMYLSALEWGFTEIGVHDLAASQARSFREHIGAVSGTEVRVFDSVEELVRNSDVVVYATTAATPYVTDPAWFEHGPLVLHLSLRDLAPEVLLSSYNLVDDVEHCLTANTSPHLTEQLAGSRDFIAGTFYDVLTGVLTPPVSDTVIFSPFGLGVLDLALGRFVYDECRRTDDLTVIKDFFP